MKTAAERKVGHVSNELLLRAVSFLKGLPLVTIPSNNCLTKAYQWLLYSLRLLNAGLFVLRIKKSIAIASNFLCCFIGFSYLYSVFKSLKMH